MYNLFLTKRWGMEEIRNVHTFNLKSERKALFRTPKRRWEDNIKMYVRERQGVVMWTG
jgi:hypothetical protein